MTDLSKLSRDDLLKLVAQMQAQPARKLTLKVTAERTDDKTGKTTGTNGAVSLYGLGRFPVTLYASGWERLLDAADDIRAFIKVNEAIIARKA